MIHKNSTAKLICALAAAIMMASGCSDPFDPSYLDKEISALTSRIERLEQQLAGVNGEISAMRGIVSALQKNTTISSVDKVDGGFVITFSDGKTYTIRNGQNGANGANGSNGSTPVIGVTLIDGSYYWTVDGKPLRDGDRYMAVTGENGKTPKIGVKAEDGILYWTVDGQFLLDENGNKVPASGSGNSSEGERGDSLFSDVQVKDGIVTFTLTDGTTFVIPFRKAAKIRIEANKLHFDGMERKIVHVDAENIVGATVADKPLGWRVRLDGCALSIQAPDRNDPAAERDGYVAIIATAGDQTLIGKVFVTTDEPLFEMNVRADGVMTLTEKSIDFNMPGWLAGFTEAAQFDAEAIVEPAKAYNPQTDGKDDKWFYNSWMSSFTGTKSVSISLDSLISRPQVGKRYAAYCFPGYYSKAINVMPNPYDVEVRYFTFIREEFEVLSAGKLSADIRVGMDGADSYYGGIIACGDRSDAELAAAFIEDARQAMSGIYDGMYGTMVSGNYRGALSGFAGISDGEGGKNAWNLTPGTEYAVGLIPMDGERLSSEYTAGDVIIEKVALQKPEADGKARVTIAEADVTTTSVTAVFTTGSEAVKTYKAFIRKDELEGDAYTYALSRGRVWDSSVKGAGSGNDRITINNCKPGSSYLAIAVAFDADGDYTLETLEIKAKEISYSAASFDVNCTVSPWHASWMGEGEYHETLNQVKFTFTAGPEIVKVRKWTGRAILTWEDFMDSYTASSIYEDLMNDRYSYDEQNVGEAFTITGRKDDESVCAAFFIGVDKDGAFTAMKTIKYVSGGSNPGARTE